jgi:hypothetical protein
LDITWERLDHMCAQVTVSGVEGHMAGCPVYPPWGTPRTGVDVAVERGTEAEKHSIVTIWCIEGARTWTTTVVMPRGTRARYLPYRR